jgi:16S rRNA processing protein RimM
VTTDPPARVTVARILRPQGRRGEVAAEILTDSPERLLKLTSAELWTAASGGRPLTIRGCWISESRGGQAIFHFEGSDSISDAERLVGCEVRIPRGERAPLPEASHYIDELLGCEVWERSGAANRASAEERIGEVRDVQFTGGTPILVVDDQAAELLIPFAQEICVHVDVPARRIEVVLPEGLRDLNRK